MTRLDTNDYPGGSTLPGTHFAEVAIESLFIFQMTPKERKWIPNHDPYFLIGFRFGHALAPFPKYKSAYIYQAAPRRTQTRRTFSPILDMLTNIPEISISRHLLSPHHSVAIAFKGIAFILPHTTRWKELPGPAHSRSWSISKSGLYSWTLELPEGYGQGVPAPLRV